MKILRAVAVASILVIVAAGAVLHPGAENASNLLRYAGRFHILALHAPIGVLVLALLAEPLTFSKRYRRTGDLIVGFALPVLVLTGVGAILLGLALAHGGDYPAKLVAKHRNLTSVGVVVAAVAMLAWPYRKRLGRWPHRALLAGAAFFVSVGAHFGGSLTHGADYLFAPLEAPAAPKEVAVAEDAGAPPVVDAGIEDAAVEDAAVEDASVDAAVAHDAGPPPIKLGPKQIAQSVLMRRCAPCHTTNSKGGLRISMDPSKMKASEVVAGNPDESRIYTRLTLPVDDEYHMPPEKSAQPTKGEVAAVRQWIVELGK